MNNSNEISIYIHYPFCKSKCPYCDFNSHVENDIDVEDFKDAYLKEIEYFYNITNYKNIKSIFFGGGTPSLAPIGTISSIIDNIGKLWNIDKNTEISLEANPTSVEYSKFIELSKIGINRLSLGIQSLDNKDLKFLGRTHSAEDALKAIDIASQNFSNFSFDLIYGRPGQNINNWQKELKEALNIGSPHLSLYQLTIEKGTKFYKEYKNNNFIMPDIDYQSEFYDATNNLCAKYNLDNYEISNYAKEGYETIHNLNYWQYGDYIGIGAGAHGRIKSNDAKFSTFNHHKPKKWIDAISSNNHAIQQKKKLDQNDILEEIFMMGLRTKYGISNQLLQKYFNKNYQDMFCNETLKILEDNNLIILSEDNIKTSYEGSKVLNSVILKLLESI